MHYAVPGHTAAELIVERSTRIDKFLEGDDRSILDDADWVYSEYAKEYAESEFEKYRVIQDHLFQSDFDRLMDGDNLLEHHETDQ